MRLSKKEVVAAARTPKARPSGIKPSEPHRVSQPVREFEVVYHGIDHEQFFPGCGTAHTRFTEAFSGIGDSPRAAAEDALEAAAQCSWDTEHRPLLDEVASLDDVETEFTNDEQHHYVSILLR
jgi:hypothetical protein